MFELITSVILLIPTGDNVEGQKTYHLIVNKKAYEYVYIEEVKNFYRTGTFVYNEELVENKED
jgi:hypothetical protein